MGAMTFPTCARVIEVCVFRQLDCHTGIASVSIASLTLPSCAVRGIDQECVLWDDNGCTFVQALPVAPVATPAITIGVKEAVLGNINFRTALVDLYIAVFASPSLAIRRARGVSIFWDDNLHTRFLELPKPLHTLPTIACTLLSGIVRE